MDSVRNDLLYLLWQAFLQRLWDLGVACCMRDFASLLVAFGIVECVWNLVLDTAGNLHIINSCS